MDELEALRGAIARLRVAAMVVDHRRRLLPMNAYAASIVDREQIVVRSIDREENNALVAVMRSIVDDAPEGARRARVTSHSGIEYDIWIPEPGAAGAWHMLLLEERDGSLAEARDARLRGWRLTTREAEVARLMADGWGSASICTELGIGSSTLRTHVRRILEKSHSHSRSEFLAKLLRE